MVLITGQIQLADLNAWRRLTDISTGFSSNRARRFVTIPSMFPYKKGWRLVNGVFRLGSRKVTTRTAF